MYGEKNMAKFKELIADASWDEFLVKLQNPPPQGFIITM